MSEIPFVDRLGDAIEAAIAPAPARRRRRRRFGGLAIAILLLGAGGVTVAEILDDPEKLAVGPVACYDRPSLEANVSVLSAEGRSPTAVCAKVLRTDEPLVGCVRAGHVFVFPGRDTCARLGLRPLPEGYDAANAKVARLRRALDAIVRSADCIPPARLAQRLQRVLDREGWRGWRAVVDRSDFAQGPCGWTSVSEGLRFDERRLTVRPGAPRSLDRLLTAAGERLIRLSGRRCHTVGSLRRRVRREVAATKLPLSFTLDTGPLPRYHELLPPSRNRRFREGCAVFEGAAFRHPPLRVVVELRVKRA
jgi:hypothetical protein